MDKSFEVYTLFSSSKGNSVYIRAGHTRLLIDIGRSRKAINDALVSVGSSLGEIDAIFITHAHSDHTCGLCAIAAKEWTPIHTTRQTAEQLLCKCAEERLTIHEEHFCVEIGDVRVHSFVTPHDSHGSVGYVVDYKGSYRFGICTDTGCISREMAEELIHCDGVLIEANYDEEMLQKGPYPYYLKQRISANTGHLSNNKAAQLCCILARAGVKKIMLGHISSENNLPELALKCCCKELLEKGYNDIDITVADRYVPTKF